MSCVVPFCPNKKSKTKRAKLKIGYFHFPRNKVLRQKWIDAIPFYEGPTSYAVRVCGEHFTPEDFVIYRKDSNTYRMRERGPLLKYKRLKVGAIPSVFIYK